MVAVVSMRGAKRLQDELEGFALSLPEAWFDTPWDESRVTKVRKQIFAFYGDQDAPSIGVRLVRVPRRGYGPALAPPPCRMGWAMTAGPTSRSPVLTTALPTCSTDSSRKASDRSLQESLVEQLDDELAD